MHAESRLHTSLSGAISRLVSQSQAPFPSETDAPEPTRSFAVSPMLFYVNRGGGSATRCAARMRKVTGVTGGGSLIRPGCRTRLRSAGTTQVILSTATLLFSSAPRQDYCVRINELLLLPNNESATEERYLPGLPTSAASCCGAAVVGSFSLTAAAGDDDCRLFL